MALGRPVPLRALAAADAELEDAAVADDLPDAADDRRVREAVAEVFLAQVRVRVEVDDGDVGVLFVHGAEGRQRHEVLAANEERQLAVRDDVPRARFDVRERTLRVAEAELEVAAVKDFRVLEVEVLIRAVRLEAVRLRAHRAARKARARTVRRRRVEWRAVEHDAALLVVAFTAEEGLDITIPVQHLLASPPHNSAGQRRPRAAACCSSAS